MSNSQHQLQQQTVVHQQKSGPTSYTIVEAQGTQPRAGQPATTTQLIPASSLGTGGPGVALNETGPAVAGNNNNKFVLSSEYISQTIRKALKQDNLTPEQEEKLLNQLKYHENILKQEQGSGGGCVGKLVVESDPSHQTLVRPPPPGYGAVVRKRPAAVPVGDGEGGAGGGGVTPSKKSRGGQLHLEVDENHHSTPTKRSPSNATHTASGMPRVPRQPGGRSAEEKRKLAEQRLNTKLLGTLNKHKELLKKDMLRKRSLLEKDLLFCIQRDIAKELSSLRQAPAPVPPAPSNSLSHHHTGHHTTPVHHHYQQQQAEHEPDIQRAPAPPAQYHQTPVLTGSSKRKSAATPTTTIQPTPGRGRGRGRGRGSNSRGTHHDTGAGGGGGHHHRKVSPSLHSSSTPDHMMSGRGDQPRGAGAGAGAAATKKEKLLCMCRTPYDETKFYVGCDLCNNWFHGDCVDITEEMSKTLTEFVCADCKRARETQELFCLCKQPYDESQFYICCDTCQDWFHGRCVGILQSEADNIDEYICPNCNNSASNLANMKNLTPRDFDSLKKLIKQIQTHKSAWPFMEPVDPHEAPDYYNVVKEPMDLKTIELRIAQQRYKKLSDFIGDMTKIFDNCRYYNPRESPFFKHAHALETFFVSKVKTLREKLIELK
uniref:Nucleosome-remodeling factor subunit NURF301 n=2 Tax=Cacopsylla melanoneura TaxID=428564 RepID=A0A8D8XN76_9HEMI